MPALVPYWEGAILHFPLNQYNLNGAYLIAFPAPVDDFASLKEQLLEDALRYIRSTQTMTSAPKKVILTQSGHVQCSVQKLHSLSDEVELGGPGRTGSEGEAAEEICTLLQERLDNKRHKLRNTLLPKILLLYDEYHFADRAMFADCLPGLSELTGFHTVFVVHGEDSFVLHSKNEEWLHAT